MTKVVINIVGLAGSGKSEISKFLEDNFGFYTYKTSSVLRQYAEDHGIKLNGREDYFKCHKLMNQDDPLAIIRPVLDSKHSRICLDGMRAPAPFAELKDRFGAILIFLDVSREVRFERISKDLQRTGHRLAKSPQHLDDDESVDYSDDPYLPNMDKMRQMADYTIDASQDLDAVLKDIKDILRQRFDLKI